MVSDTLSNNLLFSTVKNDLCTVKIVCNTLRCVPRIRNYFYLVLYLSKNLFALYRSQKSYWKGFTVTTNRFSVIDGCIRTKSISIPSHSYCSKASQPILQVDLSYCVKHKDKLHWKTVFHRFSMEWVVGNGFFKT